MTKFKQLFDKAFSAIEDKYKIDVTKYADEVTAGVLTSINVKGFEFTSNPEKENTFLIDPGVGGPDEIIFVEIFPKNGANVEFTVMETGKLIKTVIIIPSFTAKKDIKKVINIVTKFLKIK